MTSDRKAVFAKARRIVVKIGSGVIADSEGLDHERVMAIAEGVAELMAMGKQVVVVSSGSIASGRAEMGFLTEPRTIPEKQACAALGQAGLMQAWECALEVYGRMAAQLLLTAPGLRLRDRFLNARNTIFTLLGWGVVPIVNENDTVVVEEIKLGDNDNLAAMLTNLLGADIMISLTNVDGVYDCDPRENSCAKVIPMVWETDSSMLHAASGQPGKFGRGGMLSKIKAAEKSARCGAYTVIANGLTPKILQKLAAGEDTGTLFMPSRTPLRGRKHWIAFTASQNKHGRVIVDQGAANALKQSGKSLLPVGIKDVCGPFEPGDAVQVQDPDGHILGIGLCNYGDKDLSRIKGLHTREITAGAAGCFIEAIHRDNLVIFRADEEESISCLLDQ